AATAGDRIEFLPEVCDQRAHGLGVAGEIGRGGIGGGMKRHGLQLFIVRRNPAPGSRVMVSLRRSLRQPRTFGPAGMPGQAFSGCEPVSTSLESALVGPVFAAPECEIVGMGGVPAGRPLRPPP